MGQPQLVACLAVTLYLARSSNVILQGVIPSGTWATMAVTDLLAEGIDLTGNPDQRFRKVKAFVRRYYGPLGLSETDLKAAMTSAGL